MFLFCLLIFVRVFFGSWRKAKYAESRGNHPTKPLLDPKCVDFGEDGKPVPIAAASKKSIN